MKRFFFIILYMVISSSFVWAQTDSSTIDQPEKDYTLEYHGMAVQNAALKTPAGYKEAIFYEKKAFKWEATHDMVPEAMCSLLNNIAFYNCLYDHYKDGALYAQLAISMCYCCDPVNLSQLTDLYELKNMCDSIVAAKYSRYNPDEDSDAAELLEYNPEFTKQSNTYFITASILQRMYESWGALNVLHNMHKQESHSVDENTLRQLYYMLVKWHEDENDYDEVIQYASLYPTYIGSDESLLKRNKKIISYTATALYYLNQEKESQALFTKHGLYENYVNLLYEQARRENRKGHEEQAEQLKECARKYARKYKATNSSSYVSDLCDKAVQLMKERKYKKAADIFKNIFANDSSQRAVIIAQAMVAYYQAGLYDLGWEYEQRLMSHPDKDNITYTYDLMMLYTTKYHVIATDSRLDFSNMANAQIELYNTQMDTLVGYNVDLIVDTGQVQHIEAQAKLGDLTIERQHASIHLRHAKSRYLDDAHEMIQRLINEGAYYDAEILCRHTSDIIQYFGELLPPSYEAQLCYYQALVAAYNGAWKQMLEYCNKALPYYNDTENYEMISLLFTLGSQYYLHFNLLETALERADIAVDALQKVPQEQWNHDRVVNVYTNFARCLFANGYYGDGYNLFSKLTEYVAENQGEDHINIAQICLRLLSYPDILFDDIYNSIELLDKAQTILNTHRSKLLETDVLAHMFGKDFVDLYTISASLYNYIQEDTIALQSSEIALRYVSRIYGEFHPYIISPLMEQITALKAEGDIETAVKNARFARRLAGIYYGQNNWTVGKIQWLIAQCELERNNIPAYEMYADSVIQNFKHNIRHEFTFLTTKQRKAYWEQQKQILDSMSVQALHINTPKMRQLLYDIVLLKKGVLLKTQIDIFDIVAHSGNRQLEDQYLSLLQLSEQQRLAMEHNLSFSREQEQEKESLEKKIMQEVLKYGDYTQSMSIEWQQVRKALTKKGVAIEFISIPMAEDMEIYCALLLRDTSTYPIMIPLFEEKQINARQQNTQEQSDLIWDKVKPYLNPGDEVFFSPTGILYQIAMENLPFDSTHTMGDVYQLVRLSSTRELAMHKKPTTITTATLYGDIAYQEMDTTVMLALSTKYNDGTRSITRSSRLIDTSEDFEPTMPLPGTKVEIQSIEPILQKEHIAVHVYAQQEACEQSVKALSGKKQNILHIATHGFFHPDNGQNSDSMNRCGLYFAGVDKVLEKGNSALPQNVDDGILTAKEISLLDLRNAELVVLSACETGLGDISGDGVFGLQRAFKQAGAQTIIMSLWPVNDAATQLLMTEFYRNWITLHQPKRKAFRNAQNTVRTRYEQPVYWAGFIMLD